MAQIDKRVGPVVRAVKLLQMFADANSDLSIKELSDKSGLAPSTIHRLVNLLADLGMVTFDEQRKRYGIGQEFFRLSAQVMTKTSFADIARPYMKNVVLACEETCVLISYLRPRQLISVVAVENSPNPLQYQTELYATRNPLWGATGQSVAAFLPDTELSDLLEESGEQVFPATGARLPDRDSYLRQMAEIREKGYALSQGETIPGAVGIGAPVFDKAGLVIGSLCVTLPEIRYSETVRDRVIGTLVPEARALSMALGYTPPAP